MDYDLRFRLVLGLPDRLEIRQIGIERMLDGINAIISREGARNAQVELKHTRCIHF